MSSPSIGAGPALTIRYDGPPRTFAAGHDVVHSEFFDTVQIRIPGKAASLAATAHAAGLLIHVVDADIVQLSFQYEGHRHHFLMCDTFGPDAPPVHTANSTVSLFECEEDLLRAALKFMWHAYGGQRQDGKPCFQRYLCGWKTHQQVWPMLANRAMRYRIPVLQALLTDPEKKWPTVYSLVDIAGIYLQGAGFSRQMPGLADLLRYWGCAETLEPIPIDMAALVCGDPVKAVGIIEPYLDGMHRAVCTYYPGADLVAVQDAALVGQSVPVIAPMMAQPRSQL
jgi:hypothetical protein